MAAPLRLVTLAADVTTVNNGAATALNRTPLLGGAGKECRAFCPVLPLTSTVLVQGAPRIDPDTGVAPVAGSSLWTTLATFTSASAQVQSIDDAPDLIRYRTSVLDADGPVVNVHIETTP
jgi:hypothetical protein